MAIRDAVEKAAFARNIAVPDVHITSQLGTSDFQFMGGGMRSCSARDKKDVAGTFLHHPFRYRTTDAPQATDNKVCRVVVFQGQRPWARDYLGKILVRNNKQIKGRHKSHGAAKVSQKRRWE